MDYKKKYEQALENIKKIKAANKDNNELVDFIEYEYPELKEGGDERIRKKLISYFSNIQGFSSLEYNYGITQEEAVAWLEKQGEQKQTLPKWKYKKDNTPLLRDSIILNKYGCVAKSPSGALVSDVWTLDYDELKKLPKEEFEKQGEQKSEINDNILLRFAFYQYDDDTLYLSSVFVEECSRKRGYGSKILKAAEEVAKTLGVSKIRLKVERNTWMEEWYKKNGYEYLCSEGEYDWLEKRIEQKHAECRQCRQETKPNGGIVYEDFNDGDGYYKVDLAYLSKSQVELIENLVASWQNHTNNIGKWSEEDENMLQKALSIIRYALSIPADKEDDPCFAGSSTIDWLKSLKERMKGE